MFLLATLQSVSTRIRLAASHYSSLLNCLDLITISKPSLSPIGGLKKKRVKSRLLPFTAKPKEPKEQRMKLEYKRMKLNTPPTTVYVPTFVYFADYFMS